MEPTTAIMVVAKLIGLGIKGASAFESHGFHDKDMAAIQALLETGSSVAALRPRVAPPIAALHLALVARSFGQAVGRHQEFHGQRALAGGLARWLRRSERERDEEIALRVQLAGLHVAALGDDPAREVDAVAQLAGSPLDTPYYRRLWRAFSDPAVALPGEQPPLVMSHTARREFERYFLLAYLAALESPAARGLTEYLDGLQRYRAVLVRDLLLQDLATWGDRHVFGNVPRARWTEDQAVPFLALDALFVEPEGRRERARDKLDEPAPLLDLLDQLTAPASPRSVIVVVADFGSGKSLSARTRACRWAERALEAPAVSLDEVLPIYIRCADDFPHEAVDLAATVQRAWKRQADDFGLSIPDDDRALAWPADRQRAVFLLDGLDEVSLGDQHLRTLFQKLRDKTTERHRFVVFSRPGALPARSELGDHVTVIRIQPFSATQIARWIEAWNQLRPGAAPVALDRITELGLGEIAATPILLFMIAFTWAGYTAERAPPSLAELYERCFQQIAAGKAEADREHHGPIAGASEALRAALVNHGVLDARASLADAMLWLMARVAWEAQILEQREPPEPLTRRHIDNLLQDDELRLPAEAAHVIKVGLILALQADLRTADHQILFGHQSFREFLVGRYWALQLQRAVRGNPRDWEAHTRPLLRGRLLGEERKGFDFLIQIINAEVDPRAATPLPIWTGADRAALERWAQDVFADEGQLPIRRQRLGVRGELRAYDDARAVLREAALAIGSTVRGSAGLAAADPLTLRSMLAWFWLRRIDPRVIAPGAKLAKAGLARIELVRPRFERAVLDGASFADSILLQADFRGACLAHTDFQRASIRWGDFGGAVLHDALLFEVRISDSKLVAAVLRGATFLAAQLVNCDLRAVDLSRAACAAASLEGVHLIEADLQRANLSDARIRDCLFRRARLAGTTLEGAELTRVDLGHADLTGACLDSATLRQVYLRDARLDGATLAGLSYDAATSWPDGFDPDARGARRAT